jgi:hypothetical protein
MLASVRVADADDELCGELRSLRPPHAPSLIGERLAATLWIGIRAGLVPSAIVFLIYLVRNRDAPLPWATIGSLLAVYGPVIGVLLATLIELFVVGADAICRVWIGFVLIANPVTAGGLAGALAGIAPGAVGVMVFGSYHGPFVGTGLIAFGLVAGAVLVAAPLARRARRARGLRDNKRVIAAATLIAMVMLSGAAAVVAPVIVGTAFVEARGAMENHEGIVGAVSGALGGGVVGVFIGLVIVLGRLSWRKNSPRPNAA